MPAADFIVVANRLPVDRVEGPDGEEIWRTSPGGLVAALEPMMRSARGAWVGWPGQADVTLEPFEINGIDLVPVTLSAEDVEDYYEGFSNDTIWPLYHDVIAPPQYHREWWDAYVRVNRRFAEAAAAVAAPNATVWVHDYQLQLVPQMIREIRDDLSAIEQAMRTELDAAAEKRRQLLSGLLTSVGRTVSDIRQRYRNFSNRNELLGQASGGALTPQEQQSLQAQMRDDQTYIQEQNYFGHDMLVTIIENYDAADLDNQAKIAAAELRQRNLDNVADGVLIAAAVARELQRGDRQYSREEVLRLTLNGL